MLEGLGSTASTDHAGDEGDTAKDAAKTKTWADVIRSQPASAFSRVQVSGVCVRVCVCELRQHKPPHTLMRHMDMYKCTCMNIMKTSTHTHTRTHAQYTHNHTNIHRCGRGKKESGGSRRRGTTTSAKSTCVCVCVKKVCVCFGVGGCTYVCMYITICMLVTI